MQENKILVIGSGPAGYTAAIYASRGGYETIVISGRPAGWTAYHHYRGRKFPWILKGNTGTIINGRDEDASTALRQSDP